jgi:hypothetical protein
MFDCPARMKTLSGVPALFAPLAAFSCPKPKEQLRAVQSTRAERTRKAGGKLAQMLIEKLLKVTVGDQHHLSTWLNNKQPAAQSDKEEIKLAPNLNLKNLGGCDASIFRSAVLASFRGLFVGTFDRSY